MDNNFEYRVYLKSLSKQFPTIADAATEIINLQAILSLPKGTEHFLTDIHGEYEQFNHVLKNGSGSVRRKIDEEFGNTLSVKDKRSLATLIYYPQEKLELVCQEEADQDVLEDWFKITIHRLGQMTKRVSSKYTRSKVRKALPHDFSYVIEELITEKEEIQDKELYYNEIINTIIRIGRAPECIIALCNLIQRLVIDHLHIVGDIYDRGKGPHVIMDTLSAYHSVDIQWGNHDIVWMGAASGQTACMATVLRISARYGNLDTLEEGYGINLIPLATFALKTYENSDCSVFSIKYGADYDVKDLKLDMMMHKAIAIIQFKLEGQLILAHPEYHMDDRLLLDKIDFEKGTVRIGDKEYEMLDSDFPTVDPKDPYRLTAEEEQVVERLRHAFVHCEKLQKHVRFLFAKGSMYKIFNSNLLYHGCVPMDEDGNFEQINVYGKLCSGKKLYEVLDLKLGKCRMCVCGPESARELLQHHELIRVATKYPAIAKDYFYNKKHQTVDIIKLNGSVELGPLVELSDVIVDIVETGSTLKENGLEVLEEVCPLSARMIVNPVSMQMEADRIRKLVGAIREQLKIQS